MKEKGSDDLYVDYIMSEKFGLDWQEYDAKRMNYFLHIMALKGEKAENDTKKNKPKGKNKFRKRG